MDISNQILFFLAGLGVFNGLILIFYLFFVLKPKRWINILLALLMLMLCLRIGKSVLYVFTDLERIYLQIGLSACMMIGPFLFLYVRHFVSKKEEISKSDILHITIPLLTIVSIGSIWPYEYHPAIWSKYLVKFIYGIWFLYTVAASIYIIPLIKKALNKQTSIGNNWILLVYAFMLLICISYILAYIGFPYLGGPILFSIVLYVLTGFLFSKKNRSIILAQETTKYQGQKLSDQKAQTLLQELDALMKSQQPYLNRKAKLADIAKSISATPHEVSHVINNHLGISFNQYINQFRIKVACDLLLTTEHLTIEGIGQEVGFNSRSSFYTAFKSVMNQTPAQYKAQIKHSEP